jgi:DNA-binding NarL/FixJ family response regulator
MPHLLSLRHTMGLCMTEEADAQENKISVVIIDDHQIFRQGVEANLQLHPDIVVIGYGSNGEQALKLLQKLKPDVALLDINLPLMNGMQVLREVVNQRLPVRVVLMTAYDDPEQVLHAMRAGAAAYCAKEIHPDQLVELIRLVVEDRYVVNEQVFDKDGIEAWTERGVEAVAGQYYAELADTFSPLSPREMEILQYVTRGMSNKEIAQLLDISHQTVKNHMTSILRKLAVDDRTQAAVYALRRGWVRLRDTVSRDDTDWDEED